MVARRIVGARRSRMRSCWPAPIVHAAAVHLDAADRAARRPRRSSRGSFGSWPRRASTRSRISRAPSTPRRCSVHAQRRDRRAPDPGRAARWSRSLPPMRWPSCASRGRQRAVRAGPDGAVRSRSRCRRCRSISALAKLGLLDTYFALMLPFFLSVFAIFLFRQFFKTFPDEIIQAARLDGVGEFEIVWRIVVPSALAGDRCLRDLLDRCALERPLLADDRVQRSLCDRRRSACCSSRAPRRHRTTAP